MPQRFGISIEQVVTLLGLEREPKRQHGSSYNVKCPFCDDKKYHMNINTEKDTYNCVHCGGKSGGGALDLYGRVRLGVELKPGKSHQGGNGNVLYRALCEELNIGNSESSPYRDTPRHERSNQEVNRVIRASDDMLDKAYTALLDFPPFALTDEHRANLDKRGLDGESIANNKYRSITPKCDWLVRFQAHVKRYEMLELEKECLKYDKLKRLTKEQRVAGFVVGSVLSSFMVQLDGVPGFFKLKDRWLFKMEPGMLIPTRNRAGQIVGLQARKDSGELRYMTISSKDLPEGVTEGIARAHFPLANDNICEGVPVLLTEGPLKADVAVHLLHDMGKQCHFVAVQGVNNTNELPSLFKELVKQNVSVIQNALDMDKLTNPHVAKACRAIRRLAHSTGLKVRTEMWDGKYARHKLVELDALCKKHSLSPGIDYAKTNVFVSVGKLADLLYKNGIDHSLKTDENGCIVKDKEGDTIHQYWSDDTKGIDDYLLGLALSRQDNI